MITGALTKLSIRECKHMWSPYLIAYSDKVIGFTENTQMALYENAA